MTHYQRGFGIVEVILVVVAVAILGGVGYVAYNNFAAPKKTADTYQTEGTASMKHGATPPSINKTSDLDTASQSVDDSSYENDGVGELDAQLGSF